jgi:hypothetical protein
VFHANDRHSPHWSEDFVEHIRTVHFALVAVCLGLIGLLQFEKPKDVKTAQSQLQEIKLAVDSWDSEPGVAAVRDAFSNAGAGHFGIGQFSGFEIFQENLMFTDTPLIWVPSEKTGGGEAINSSDFINKMNTKPNSLAEFREFWNLLGKKLQVWSVDRQHLPERYVVVNADGSVSVMNYKLQTLTSGQTVDPTLSDEDQRQKISGAFHVNAPECVYSFSKGGSTMLLPVAVSSKKEIDTQAALITTHPYWKEGVFSKSFSELETATAGRQDSSFEALASSLADEAAKPRTDSFEIFGVKFPVESASRWGIVLILGIQLYLWIHLYEVSPRLKEGDPGWDVAWIGVYQSVPAKILFFASTALLPLITITALGYHAFVALGSHATRTVSASVWAIYLSAVVVSLILSVLISKGIPRHYDVVRRSARAADTRVPSEPES